MIEVIIRHTGSKRELGRIEIENVSDGIELGDYSIRFAIDKIGAVGIHQRSIFRFPRTKFNVFALLLQALNTMEPRDLEHEGSWGDRSYESKTLSARTMFE